MELKNCSRCRQELPLDQFSWKKKNVSRQPYCKECNKSYHKEHYQQNKQDYINKAKVTQKKLISKIDEIKRTTPCSDCHKLFNPWQMDFDHRENKEFGICKALRRQGIGWKRLQKEIVKCDLVCANCHRNRTHNRLAHSSSG